MSNIRKRKSLGLAKNASKFVEDTSPQVKAAYDLYNNRNWSIKDIEEAVSVQDVSYRFGESSYPRFEKLVPAERCLRNLSILNSARNVKVSSPKIKSPVVGAVAVPGYALADEDFGYEDVETEDLIYMAAWLLYGAGMPPSAIERVLPVIDDSVNYKGTEPVWLYQPVTEQSDLKEAIKQIIVEVLDGE